MYVVEFTLDIIAELRNSSLQSTTELKNSPRILFLKCSEKKVYSRFSKIPKRIFQKLSLFFWCVSLQSSNLVPSASFRCKRKVKNFLKLLWRRGWQSRISCFNRNKMQEKCLLWVFWNLWKLQSIVYRRTACSMQRYWKQTLLIEFL